MLKIFQLKINDIYLIGTDFIRNYPQKSVRSFTPFLMCCAFELEKKIALREKVLKIL